MVKTDLSRPTAPAIPAVPPKMATPNDRGGAGRGTGWWRRVWQRLTPPPGADLVLAQLNGQLAVLEGAHAELEAGWVQGGWWTVSSSDGSPWLVSGSPTAGGIPDHVDGVCLVGALVRAGARRPDAEPDVGRAVDAVYDALWASRGQPGPPPAGGLPPVPPPKVRLARVRTLTQWNDRAERTGSDVLALVDRAIGATIMALMAAPRPAAPPPGLGNHGSGGPLMAA
jgi:hypothetical protein